MIGWAAFEAVVKYPINTQLWPRYGVTVSINYCFKMSDYFVNFDLLDGLNGVKWWKEMDRIEEEDKKKRKEKCWS